VEESLDAIEEYKQEIAALEKERDQALHEVKERWEEIVNQVDEITVTPYKKDVQVDLFGVAWFPYHLVQIEQDLIELPGFLGE
jgi:hypothetical protein